MRATVREIEEAAQAMIEYVDTSAYSTFPWTPARHPLDLVGTVETPRELLYTAAIIGGDHTERWTGGCDADEIEGVLQVQFLLREVRGDERESTRRAADAGEHLARALTSPPWRSRRVAGPTLRTMLEAEGSTRWILCTQEILVTYYLDLTAIAQPPGVAPAFLTPPAIVGTFDEGEVLTAIPGTVTGTGPISRVYRWIWQGGPAATYGATAQVPAGATSVVVEETATGAVAPPAVAVSQSLGVGGGPVDCEVTCAATIAAAEVVATAAERARALGWLYLGKAGVVNLTFSDPAGLLSASSLDSATGIFAVTADPGIQTATPETFAGWEGRIYGPVDGVDFATIGQMLVARLIRDTAVTQTGDSDLEAIVFFADGPRATATIGFGGGFRATISTNNFNRRAVHYVLRTTWTRFIATPQLGLPAVQTSGSTGANVFQTTTRSVEASGALSTVPGNGAQGIVGNALAPAEWPQVWVSVLFGRIVGNGVAPNNAAESARVMPVFTYTAPDWTLTAIPP